MTVILPSTNSRLVFASNVTKQIGNVQTATSVIPAGVNFLTGTTSLDLPDGFWAKGRSLRVGVRAVYSSDTLTTGASVAVALGASSLASVTVGALANNTTNQAVDGDVTITCVGASGGNAQLVTSGTMKFLTGVNQTTNVMGNLSSPGAVTVPNTAALLDVTCLFSANRPVQQVTTLAATAEQLN